MDGGGGGGDPMSLEDFMIDLDADDLLFPDEEAFPSLPDFPCLPSPPRLDLLTNSSNSDPLSPSSSSSSSWNFLPPPNGALVTEPFGNAQSSFADSLLQDDIELWDPNSLVPEQGGNNSNNNNSMPPLMRSEEDGGVAELGEVFLEWLKKNRDAISPEDLRSIKLKKSTIERAAARLGEGREGRMKLVKLILAWVQNNHLRKRRRQQQQQQRGKEQNDRDVCPCPQLPPVTSLPVPSVPNDVPANPNPSPGFECNFDEFGFHKYNPWVQYPAADPMVMPNGGGDQPAGFYCPNGGSSGITFSSQPFSPLPQMVPIFHGVPPPQMGCAPYPQPIQMQPPPQYQGGLMYQAPSPGGTSSATREARKKRMARQRCHSTLHQKRSNAHQQQHGHQPHAVASPGGGSSSASSHASPRNWAVLSDLSSSPSHRDVVKPTTANAHPANESNMQQKRNVLAALDKRQSCKSEKNFRFLLKKVLKQSDVGSLGRIVLPKKEAEIHLPELDASNGISIPMEDIGTSRIWNMRYRFWPNNKSRMYLLENTGDFVRANGLQEGDFIVIYSDVKCNKYMIRGVKVRSPPEKKGSAGNKSSGKEKQKKNGRDKSSISSLDKATSGYEGNQDDMMEELLADGEGEDMASSSIIKIDDA